MTPQMLQLFSHALQTCLDQGYYPKTSRKDSSVYMCQAFWHAYKDGQLTEEEKSQLQKFLGRWVRWQAHLLGVTTITLGGLVLLQRGIQDSHRETWYEKGLNVEYYRELIQRLNQKAQVRGM